MKFILLKTLTAQRTRQYLLCCLVLIKPLKNSPLRALANTHISWMEPIVAMWRFSKSNGITEGFHNKVVMMSSKLMALGILRTID